MADNLASLDEVLCITFEIPQEISGSLVVSLPLYRNITFLFGYLNIIMNCDYLTIINNFEPFFLGWRRNTFLVEMFSRLGLGEYFDS